MEEEAECNSNLSNDSFFDIDDDEQMAEAAATTAVSFGTNAKKSYVPVRLGNKSGELLTLSGRPLKSDVCIKAAQSIVEELSTPITIWDGEEVLPVEEDQHVEGISIGIHTRDGILFLASDPRSVGTIANLDEHLVCASAGLIADARTWVEHARVEAQNFWFTYGKKIRVEDITYKVSKLALHFGDDDSEIRLGRPFGVSMLFAGIDHTGAHLFHLDPSGTYTKCLAKAIGGGADGAEQTLQEHCKGSDKKMDMDEAKKVALDTLKQLMEEKINVKNVEVVLITPGTDENGVQVGNVKWMTEEELGEMISSLIPEDEMEE